MRGAGNTLHPLDRVKRGPGLSQSRLRSLRQEPRWSAGRRARPGWARFRARAQASGDTSLCGADMDELAPFGAPPPSLYEPEASLKELCCCGGRQTSGAEANDCQRARNASRERICISSLPGRPGNQRPRACQLRAVSSSLQHGHRVMPGGDAEMRRGLSGHLSQAETPLTQPSPRVRGEVSPPLTGRALSCHVARVL